ncbi:MAG: hypothetical protein HY001_00525 [Candidatus Portnoybacteria bacterium]|nr:hypothetical protein [Candidatus Portnoybacteria bacterium]
MATIKPRINITLPHHTKRVLTLLAQRDHVPEATKATYLLELALELEEDQVWDSIAKRRDTKKAKFISHKNAWS